MKNPYVGQKVTLNDLGLRTIFGFTLGLSPMKAKIFTFTMVENVPMNLGEESSVVTVDDPEFNEYFLLDCFFDEVKP